MSESKDESEDLASAIGGFIDNLKKELNETKVAKVLAIRGEANARMEVKKLAKRIEKLEQCLRLSKTVCISMPLDEWQKMRDELLKNSVDT